MGRLAQLVRALRLHRRGRGFESLSAHYVINTTLFLFIFEQKHIVHVLFVCILQTNQLLKKPIDHIFHKIFV